MTLKDCLTGLYISYRKYVLTQGTCAMYRLAERTGLVLMRKFDLRHGSCHSDGFYAMRYRN